MPLTFFNVTSATIDTGTNDGGSPNDKVTVNAGALVAAGLKNFTVSTGAGNDELVLNLTRYALPVAGGAFNFQAGGGSGDKVTATANVSFTLKACSMNGAA